MKILFLRVGIDRGCGGTLSPLFEDGTFEYVPIPDKEDMVAPDRGVRYNNLLCRHGGTMERYAHQNCYAHYDPEFESMTYGEPNAPKRNQLLSLNHGDYLVFYAGFQGEQIEKGACFVIGYFVVNAVYLPPIDEAWPPQSLAHLHRNAHFRRKSAEASLVVVEGDSRSSKLLNGAKQLSDNRQIVLPAVQEIVGFGGSVKRAVGRWVLPSHCEKTVEWLTA